MAAESTPEEQIVIKAARRILTATANPRTGQGEWAEVYTAARDLQDRLNKDSRFAEQVRKQAVKALSASLAAGRSHAASPEVPERYIQHRNMANAYLRALGEQPVGKTARRGGAPQDPSVGRFNEQDKAVLEATRTLLWAATTPTAPSNLKRLVADQVNVYRQNYDRSAIGLHKALLEAKRAVEARARFERYGSAFEKENIGRFVKEANRELSYFGVSGKRPEKASPQSAPKKKITNAEAAPPGSAKRMATYAANFKKAQDSLPQSSIATRQKWIKKAKPQDVEGVIVENDDHVLGIYLNDHDVEALEERDAQAMKEWAAGFRPPCPIAKYEVVDKHYGFKVEAYVEDDAGDWLKVGSLEAKDEGGDFVSGYSDVPIPTLAACPGLGNGLYLEASKEACRRDGVLMGSDHRSVFSEYFWKKQIRNKRATCREPDPNYSSGDDDDDDDYRDDEMQMGALYYPGPARDAERFLRNGQISVPQYNELRRRMPSLDSYTERWDCQNVPMRKAWCRLPESEQTVRGVKARGGKRRSGGGRYRLTSALPAPRYRIASRKG
jgi:hypothetical protein